LFFFNYDMIDVNLGYFFVTKIAKLCIQNLTQGPQKIFGGPHFGHPCYKELKYVLLLPEQHPILVFFHRKIFILTPFNSLFISSLYLR